VMQNENLPVILGNKEELAILFVNLISHAISSCRPSESPRVVIDSTSLRQEWEISLSYNGVDMPNEDIARAFELFARLDKDGQVSGTGISLAVCKKVVEHHGGHIRLEAKLGEGVRFVMTFPYAPQTIST
jgi:signal transduction histidine kinase